jgi:hypothetical protein
MAEEEKILSDYTVSASSIVMGLIVVALSWLSTINMTKKCCDNDMHIKFQILLTIGMVNVLIGATGWLDGPNGHPIVSFIYFIISSVILFTIGGSILSEENAEGCSDKVKNYTYGIIGMGVGIVAVHALSLYGHFNIWRKKATIRTSKAVIKLKEAENTLKEQENTLKKQEADLEKQKADLKKQEADVAEANRVKKAEDKFNKEKLKSEAKYPSKRTKLTQKLFKNACDLGWNPLNNTDGDCSDGANFVFETNGEGDPDIYKSNIAAAAQALKLHKDKDADTLRVSQQELENKRAQKLEELKHFTALKAEVAKHEASNKAASTQGGVVQGIVVK